MHPTLGTLVVSLGKFRALKGNKRIKEELKKETFCVGLTACECPVPGPTVISPVGPLGRGLEGLSQAHTQRLRGHFVCNFSPGGVFADRPGTHSLGPISCLDFAGGSSWPPCCRLAQTRQFRSCSQNDLSKKSRLGVTPIQRLTEGPMIFRREMKLLTTGACLLRFQPPLSFPHSTERAFCRFSNIRASFPPQGLCTCWAPAWPTVPLIYE